MTNLANHIELDPVRAFVYGVTGSAKTTLAGLTVMYPELAPVYFFDWDLRISSLRAKLPKEYWPAIEVDSYRDTNIGGEGFSLMQAKVEKLDYKKFKTVVVDSMTFMMMGIMNRVLMLASKPITQSPTLPNYMERQSIVKDLLSRMCAKPTNLIWTCMEGAAKDEVNGQVYRSFEMDPKLIPIIPGYFNEVWHTEVQHLTGQEPQYVVRVRSNETYAARTTYKSLLSVEPQATIWQKIIAEKFPKTT